jgi:hypothetical protein
MFKSSYKVNSVCVSYARSLDKLLQESFNPGADSHLASTVRGGGNGEPATFLAYTQIPGAQLIMPENVKVPRQTYKDQDGIIVVVGLKIQEIDRLSEARDRAIRETEALHLPLPGSGGCTFAPLVVFENPFPSLGKGVEIKLVEMPADFLAHYQ